MDSASVEPPKPPSEDQMTNCEYLSYKKGGCSSCAGWLCVADGSEKRLLDTAGCRYVAEWRECPRYLALAPSDRDLTMMNEATEFMARVQPTPPDEAFFKLVRPPTLDNYSIPCPYQDQGLCYAANPPGVIYYFRTCRRTRQWINCQSYLKALEERRVPPLRSE